MGFSCAKPAPAKANSRINAIRFFIVYGLIVIISEY
jgi:hypothetical protein